MRMFVSIGVMAAIQPRWAIDEYAMIFRVWVWFSPPQPPRSVDRMAIVRSVWVDRLLAVR